MVIKMEVVAVDFKKVMGIEDRKMLDIIYNSEEELEEITAALNELGYKPDQIIAGMGCHSKTKHFDTVVLIVKDEKEAGKVLVELDARYHLKPNVVSFDMDHTLIMLHIEETKRHYEEIART
ncbi:hypothetical protein [Methanococcus maripaludis]|uniref:Uncharacterized protein n=1 Tax=Methanococcus maripaludis TaxID=39152 RepID=A0A2L1C9W4_METMI|nr:hypothetical protein [Methanococcus maripaludis]AVB76093.1 hypothetical protein MMJJ_06790 [Methanococcus maripaludis]